MIFFRTFVRFPSCAPMEQRFEVASLLNDGMIYS